MWILGVNLPFAVLIARLAIDWLGVPIPPLANPRSIILCVFATGYVSCLAGIAMAKSVGVLSKVALAVLTLPAIVIVFLVCGFVMIAIVGVQAP